MDADERAKIIVRVTAPIGLVGLPLLLFALWDAPNPPEKHMGPVGYFLGSAFCVVGFIYSFIMCRREFGWFTKRQG